MNNLFKFFTKRNFSGNVKTCLDNSNILKMVKIDNARNKLANVNLKSCDYIFQTFWSDFAHFVYVNKKFKSETPPQTKFDILDFTNEDNIVFQNENDFIDYDSNPSKNSFIIEESGNEININEKENLDQRNCDNILISRIPQEFNLDLKVDGNLRIVNSGDTKLIAQKCIKIEFTELKQSENQIYNFDTKRLRTEFFLLNANNRQLVVNIKSYLEANKMYWSILESSLIRIKKLGLVNEGIINLVNSNVDIRSIYGPKGEQSLDFSIRSTKLQIGTVQGNIKIDCKEKCSLLIENMECTNFSLTSKDDDLSELEVYVNDVISTFSVTGGNIKVVLILNKENENKLKIVHNGDCIYNHESNNDKHIRIKTNNLPEIVEMTSWEFMKRKIKRKIKNKN